MLFPTERDSWEIPTIPGLSYRPNYVTEIEEAELVRFIDSEDWDATLERKRQPYGVSYGTVETAGRGIPAWGQELIGRMHNEKLTERPFDQMLVNEYLPGQGIALHLDYQ